MLHAPHFTDLYALGLDVTVHDHDPGPPVVSVETWANDGDAVQVSWYEGYPSWAGVRWTTGDVERLSLTWEQVTTLTVATDRGRVDIGVEIEAGGLAGRLWVHVGEIVRVSDVLLVR